MSDVAVSLNTPAAFSMHSPHAVSVRTASLVDVVLRLVVALYSFGLRARDAVAARLERAIERCRDDRGQATTEYALVLLAAALVALLLVAWATAGGGAAKISRLFNRVIDAVVDRV